MIHSSADVMRNARTVHDRLRRPANAVIDHGIDLRRAAAPPTLPSPPPPPPRLRRKWKLAVAEIAQTVADFYDLQIDDVMGSKRRRTAPFCKARQIISYLAHTEAQRSFPEIGRALGYNDHTSALYGERLVEGRMGRSSTVAIEVELLIIIIEKQMWGTP